MKMKFTILFSFLILSLFSQAPANFFVSGFAGTGACDGTLRVKTCGPYTISTNGPTGPGMSFNINNMCSGTWVVALSSASTGDMYFFELVYSPAGVTVINHTPAGNILSAFATVVSSTTSPNCNGQIALDIQGGTAPYTITWRDSLNQVIAGATNDTLAGICSGNYSFQVADNGPCTGSGTYYATLRLPRLLCTIEAQHVTCAGSCDGKAFLHIVGSGQDLISYSIFSSGNTGLDSLLNQCAGGISGEVTDSTNAHAVCFSSINEPAILLYLEDSIGIGGNLFFSVTGGTPPYLSVMDFLDTLVFNTAQVSYDSLTPGSHILSITDSVGCTLIQNLSISGSVGSLSSTGGYFAVNIFPNPSNGEFTIKLDPFGEKEAVVIEIYSPEGKLLISMNIPTNVTSAQLSTKELQNGVYMCKLFSNGVPLTTKRLMILK